MHEMSSYEFHYAENDIAISFAILGDHIVSIFTSYYYYYYCFFYTLQLIRVYACIFHGLDVSVSCA